MTVQPRSPSASRDLTTGAEPVPIRAVVSFEQFYERELRSVIGLAYALSGSRSAAEDLAQDAFVSAHRNWEKISQYDKPEAWVRRVVANLSVSRFRKGMSEAKALARMNRDEHVLPELPGEADEFWGAVRSLPKRQAQAIALHYLVTVARSTPAMTAASPAVSDGVPTPSLPTRWFSSAFRARCTQVVFL